MIYIAVRFEATNRTIDANHVTMRGLHGVLFHVLERWNSPESDWLHKHPSPKPYSMAPYFVQEGAGGKLVGVRYAVLDERTATLLYKAWQQIYHTRKQLRLGKYQTFYVSHVEWIQGHNFTDVAKLPPKQDMVLEFLSPTAFKQGPGSLPLPLPKNVFQLPLRVWQCYAPMVLSIPADWLEWCERDVFVVEHHIQTAVVSITRSESFVGFTGQVSFRAYQGQEQYLRVWQALGTLAAFCGVGHKTTMGMGAVERIQ
jgi:CRISPR-associated endoribonuclease Cas6